MKKLIYIVFCACGIYGVNAQGPADSLMHVKDTIYQDSSASVEQILIKQTATNLADSIISYAFGFMGDRYRRGGTGAKGFDCSGFTMIVFRKFGIKLPHTSAGQSLMGFEVSQKNARKGDLIFFRGRNMRSKRIGHVGIVITEKGEPIRFIHSSTSDGVRVDRIEAPYYKKRYVKTMRIF